MMFKLRQRQITTEGGYEYATLDGLAKQEGITSEGSYTCSTYGAMCLHPR
jgi:hypothetical protein